MNRLQEIRARQADIRAELEQIATRSQALDTDASRTDELLDEHDALEVEAGPLQARHDRLDAVRSAVAAPAPVVERAGVRGSVGDPTVIVRTETNPFEVDFGSVRAGRVSVSEMHSRAADGIEFHARSGNLTDDQAQAATLLLEGKRNAVGPVSRAAIAGHILKTGSPEYVDAFRAYVEDPEGTHARAALSLTSANGGYLVPFTFDPTIILTNSGSANPWRQLAEQKTTATNTWNGVNSAGVNAAWLAEAGVAADASPTFANTLITPQKAAAWVFGSYEVLEDSDFGSQFTSLMADAKDRLEEAAFATGSGSGQPFGVVPRATTVTTASVATLAAADVYSVAAALPARFRGPSSRVAWAANLSIINRVRQFDTAGGSSFWANLGMGQPEQLLGKPIYESTTMVSTITTGSKNLLIGDFSQYFIVDRVGMSVLYEPMVKDQATARPTGQAGWFAFWRVGGDVSTAANSSPAFRVLVEQ